MRRSFQWTLFAAFFAALPLPFFAFVIAGFMPLSALLVGLLATGSPIDLIHLLALSPLVYVLAKLIADWSWKRTPATRAVVALAVFGIMLGFALAPSYGAWHGSGGRYASLGDLLSQAPYTHLYRRIGVATGRMPREVMPGEERIAVQWRGPTQVQAGQEFSLEFVVSTNVPLALVSSFVMFDPQAVRLVSVSEGPLLSRAGATTEFTTSMHKDQGGGRVKAVAGTGGQGEGAAAVFVFKVLGTPGQRTRIKTAMLEVATRRGQIGVSLPAEPEIVIDP